MPMIDKIVNVAKMRKNTPEYYIWLSNVCDCTLRWSDVRMVAEAKCPHLSFTDEELQRHYRLYVLWCSLRRLRSGVRFKNVICNYLKRKRTKAEAESKEAF
jgi:hypothetical protein